ncbi:MAG: hypothetical protein ABR964_11815 [Tepidisphaeraceae bacterium]|jgi:hypothetical protein
MTQSTSQSTIATAADYAEAMLTARKAKNLLAGIIAALILVQLVVFFLLRYRFDPATHTRAVDYLKYLIGATDFLGLITPVVLAVVLLLMVAIMLVGRLIGVSRLLGAFLWCIVLGVLLFPWQAFLINQSFTSPEFKIPGVLYTWAELLARVRAHPEDIHHTLLFWARFVGWPVLSLLVLVTIHLNSRRGLRQALGEVPPQPFPRAS